jgi:16S rRNA (guanine527-N7)-methyltransferase
VSENEAALEELLVAAGIAAPLGARLAAYGALLLEANRTLNLTAAREPSVLVPHILDALTLANDVGESVVDIGSGGGLPGIPLAIATGARVLLVEAIAKKATFLSRALTELGLHGEARAERAEVLGHDPAFRGQFASATARAVSRSSTVAELTLPFLRVGGRALLQRGVLDAAERTAVIDAAPMLGGIFSEERLLSGDRRILILEKTAPTQARFPRRTGVPEKRPLCYTPPKER